MAKFFSLISSHPLVLLYLASFLVCFFLCLFLIMDSQFRKSKRANLDEFAIQSAHYGSVPRIVLLFLSLLSLMPIFFCKLRY